MKDSPEPRCVMDSLLEVQIGDRLNRGAHPGEELMTDDAIINLSMNVVEVGEFCGSFLEKCFE